MTTGQPIDATWLGVDAFDRRFALTGPSRRPVRALHAILDGADEGSLDERLDRLEDLARWLLDRRPAPPLPGAAEGDDRRTARLKFLIEVVKHHPPARQRLAYLLGSIAAETRLSRLLASTGLPERRGF